MTVAGFLCGLGVGIVITLAFVALVLSVIWNDIKRIVRYER